MPKLRKLLPPRKRLQSSFATDISMNPHQKVIDKAVAAVAAWKSGKTKPCLFCKGKGYITLKTCGCDDFCDCIIVGFISRNKCHECHGFTVVPMAEEPTPEQYTIVYLMNKIPIV